jgi:hypothetical protein
LQRQFVDKDEDTTIYNTSVTWNPFWISHLGLAFLKKDDFNVTDIIGHLWSDSAMADENQEGFMSTVENGRPAQVVENWVQ